MTNKTPSGARKHRKITKPRTRKTGQMFFFLLLQTSSILHEPLMLVYTRNQHFVQSSAQPHRLFTTMKSRKALVTTQKL